MAGPDSKSGKQGKATVNDELDKLLGVNAGGAGPSKVRRCIYDQKLAHRTSVFCVIGAH